MSQSERDNVIHVSGYRNKWIIRALYSVEYKAKTCLRGKYVCKNKMVVNKNKQNGLHVPWL